jgi:putative endopeptidase
MRRILSLFFLALLVLSCTSNPSPSPTTASGPTQPMAPAAKPMFGEHGFDLTELDRSVNPCDNFYGFATGKWKDSHPLPSTYSRYGSFEGVADRNRAILHDIVEADAAMTSAARGSNEQKVGDFYASCMASDAVEAAGIEPIRPELSRIDSIREVASLQDEIARVQMNFGGALFRPGSQADLKNSTMMIAGVSQGGLGLPEKEYYLRSDSKSQSIREAYVKHIATMFALAGEDVGRAARDADRVMAIEMALANASMDRVDMRDPDKTYHITTVADLSTMAPHIAWPGYFDALGARDLQSLNVSQPEFLKTVDQMLVSVPLEDWKAYLRWKVLDRAASSLSKAFVDENFAFNNGVLSGTQENLPRWERCVRATDASLGQLLGQEYVKRNFTPESKTKAVELINNLMAALRSDIPTLSWMSPATKQQALEKLDAFTRKIGYPDKWRDYTNLSVDRASFAQNEIRARQFAFNRAISRIGKPVDRAEWGQFTPPTVNASYNASGNEITFPAGILQPPFYDPNADDAYNYGGIGTVIGHEMTHGFDDHGARFDAKGNLRQWWTDEDYKNFQARTRCVEEEFSGFEVEPGLNEKGKAVLGEAIADLGGLTIAYAAYERSLAGKPRDQIDGFTPEQRFFLGFAQVWSQNIRAEEARRRALTDPHPLAQFRVNGTVANMPEFAKAFYCATGSKMVRPEGERCRIW